MPEPFLTELFGRAVDENGVLGDVLLGDEDESAATAPAPEELSTEEGAEKSSDA